jgi:hypothetical protein
VYGGDGGYCFIDQVNPSYQIVSYVNNNFFLYYPNSKGDTTLMDLIVSDNTGSFINPACYDNNRHVLYTYKSSDPTTGGSIYRVKNITSAPNILLDSLNITNLTDVGTDGITITNGTGAVIGASAVTIAQAQSSAGQNGYLSSTDWSNFNGKGTGSVTSISAGTGLSTGANPITTTGTIDFSDSNVGTWAATPSSANLITAMTDEVGTGKLVFNGNPNFTSITLDASTGINFDSTTGGYIGRTTSQKFGFWGATAIVQPTTGIAADTFTSGVGTVLTDADTFGGYTLAQIAAILRTSGLAA